MIKTILNFTAFLLSINSNTHEKIGKILLRNALKIATAESCTGGLLSSRLTDVAGSSAYIHANFVTYSNEAKMRILGVSERILGVSEDTLNKYGAVSAECAKEMAQGLVKLTGNDIVLCTTGVAGPSSSEQKPVGLMFAACGYNNNITVKEFRLNSCFNRKNMKFLFTEEALKFLFNTLNS